MNPFEKYFNAEKYESLLFILVGAVAVSAAVYFFMKVKQPFYNGMAFPLIAVALIQIIVGSTVYIRSPKDIVRVEHIIQADKTKIQTEEIPRMEVVMKNFKLYKWIEIILLLTGLVLFFIAPPLTSWKGVGLGLAIQAGFMLLLDFFAESRAETYLEYLRSIN